MRTTEAWVLHRGPSDALPGSTPGELHLEAVTFDDPAPDEVVVEPLYGAWDAALTHALKRSPVDLCRQRGEDPIVLGSTGVVRVAEVGTSVAALAPGDVCFLIAAGKTDRYGYIELVHGFDAPGTVGLLAKQLKLPERVLHKVPAGGRYSTLQWVPYTRYWTAWDSWKVAYGCWRSQMDVNDVKNPLAFGWGGGVTVAQLELARRAGFRVAMTASSTERIERLRQWEIEAIDRRQFPGLDTDPRAARDDPAAGERHKVAQREFLRHIHELSDGYGVSIFIDNIGGPLYRTTLKALGRQAVIATVGWKHGMRLETWRAIECIARHIHVHTHACRVSDIPEIVQFQLETGFLPDMSAEQVYPWESVPELAKDYAANSIPGNGYFPVYQVNVG